MIYARWGEPCRILTSNDAGTEFRIEIDFGEGKTMEDDAHIAYLRADGGLGEILDAAHAVNANVRAR